MLCEANYFSKESNLKYFSASQFKAFMSCESATMAALRGQWSEPCTTAMLVGQYVDAHFSGCTSLFRAQHPEIYKRDGSLKADYEDANQIIQRIEADPLMMHYLSGDHQVIMTGQIAGVDFKIKMDSYKPGAWIVDQKIMRDMKHVWEDGAYQNFVDAWGYDYQAAIYTAIEGHQLPFILAVATKDDYPDLALLEITQDVLDDRLMQIEDMLPRFVLVKIGLEEPQRCNVCPYCRATKVLSEVIDYREIDE